MAANLQLLHRRIKTAQNISLIAKAMQLIAASKIKRAQHMLLNHKPYADKITSLAQELLLRVPRKKFSHPYITSNNFPDRLLIVVSPDKGLSGSLTTNLVRRFLEEKSQNTFLVSVGKKAEAVASRTGYNLIASFPMGTHFPSYGAIYPIISIINEYYMNNKVSKVEILYSEFLSLFNQKPLLTQLLPIPEVPRTETTEVYLKDVIFEPNPDEILSSLLPHYLEVNIYHILIQSFSSEQAARLIAMQNAKYNAHDIVGYLTLEYNKTRQERITSEILDLANGQSAQLSIYG